MNTRVASRSGLLLNGMTLLLIISAVVLGALNGWEQEAFTFLLGVASAAIVGGLITSQRPDNLVGWLITAFALCFTLGEFTRQYAIYGVLTNSGALPLAKMMASPPYWIWFPGLILMMVLLPLYFPDGRLVSDRWRPVARVAIAAAVIMALLAAVQPGDGETPGIPNPLGLEHSHPLATLLSRIELLIVPSWLGLGIIATIGLIIRFRRSADTERQQLKWVAYAVTLFVGTLLADKLSLTDRLPPVLEEILFAIALECIWVAIAVAILRYRLYDIDVIINKTLVYAVLTTMLVLLYYGNILVVQQLFHVITGQESQFAVVISTLTIAALFNPLRRRIQGFIDHRFYRRKYDSQQALTLFSTSLRKETSADLEHLTGDLLHIIEETVQPSYTSVWLREEYSAPQR